MRFNEAISTYTKYKRLEREAKTLQGYEHALLNFCLYVGNPLITQVTIDQVVGYVNEMKELGWKQNTIMCKCVCFRGFFKFWAQKGYPVLNYELIPHVKQEKVLPRVAEKWQIEKLVEVSGGSDPYNIRGVALIKLLVDTGARVGEICSIDMDIDTESYNLVNGVKQWQYIIKTKKVRSNNFGSSKPFRRIFWYEDTNNVLKRWIKARESLDIKDKEALFVGVKTWRKGGRMNSYNVGLAFRRLSKRAGLEEHVNPHSIRHMFGNELGNANVNNSIISDLMGHGSLSSSHVYTHLKSPQLSRAHVRFKKRS